ncbi:hypothetical protein [Streptomyces sp. AGS-58]|uniref:hypothetical protein n=1 Tax=unclassified Streptomyces TaxID=2593676 RepID=UPI0035A2E45B
MKKMIGVLAALAITGALSAAGCEPPDDDCDARGSGIELTAAHTGKGGGSSSSGRFGNHRSTGRRPMLTKPRGNSPTRKTPSGHSTSRHGHDWFNCDDD